MRRATKPQNTVNSRPHFDSLSGVLGVYFDKRYRSHWKVRIAGKWCGSFQTLAQARIAAKAARYKLYGRFNRKD
jgi:hypothetical protein